MSKSTVIILSGLLSLLLGACGGPQQARGPAGLADLGEAAAIVMEGARADQAPAVHEATRVDGLLSQLPADPLVLFGMDTRAFLAGVADGSLLHGFARSDEQLRQTLFRMIEVLTASVTRHTTDTEWRLDFGALESMALGMWIGSDGMPYVIVAMQESFFVNAEETLAVVASAEPELVIHRRDGVVFFTDAEIEPLLDPAATRLEPASLLGDAVPTNALWFLALPDVSSLPTAARFLLYNRIGGRVDRFVHYATSEGELSFRFEGGGGAMIHHQLQSLREEVVSGLADLPAELPGVVDYFTLVSDILFSRLHVADLDGGGVEVRIPPPVCGGLLQNHGPFALLMAAVVDERPIPEVPSLFVVPDAVPIAAGCSPATLPPSLPRGLLPYFDGTPGPGQEFWASGDLFRLNLRLASSGFGLLPVRIEEETVERHLRTLLGASLEQSTVAEILVRVPPSDAFDEGAAGEPLMEIPETAGLLLRLPQGIVDQLPVFAMVIFGIDVIEHPDLGSLVVYGLGDRLGVEEAIEPRAVELIERFGAEATFLLLAGAADPDDEPEVLEGFMQELDLPEQRLSFSMRRSDGVWLQITDWADGHGARGERLSRQPGQLAGTVLDLLAETFDADVVHPDIFDAEVRDALVDWTNALYGGENLIRIADTTVSAFPEQRIASAALTSIGMMMSGLILYTGLSDKADESFPMPPEGVEIPEGYDAPHGDVF